MKLHEKQYVYTENVAAVTKHVTKTQSDSRV